MLEYSKIILRKVSFDNTLVEKEFKKALLYLNQNEKKEFINWFKQKGYL